MKLPTIAVPTYELVLPSDGRKIKYRPFLVQEEKLFLLALEGLSKDEKDQRKNQKSILETIQQIAENCILVPTNIDVEKLPSFDIEYIFLQLSAKSIDDKLNLYFDGRKNTECEECKKQKHVTVDLNTVEVKRNKKHTNKIELDKNLGLIMRYPSFSSYSDLERIETLSDSMFDLIVNCIESIYDNDTVYDAKDSTKEELQTFLNQFNKKQLQKVKEFFDTMPSLYHRVEWKCSKCGFEQHYDMEKVEDFFA